MSEDTPPVAIGSLVWLATDARRGTIVADFDPPQGVEVVIDASTTCRARRWAVQMDDGDLLFVDDQDIESAPPGR